MSYNIIIARSEIPTNEKEAWKYVQENIEDDFDLEPAQDYIELIGKLTDVYPCITELSEDEIEDGVWSDGPLVNNAGNKLTVLGLSYSMVEEVIEEVIAIITKNGFVVLDEQTGMIYRDDIYEDGGLEQFF